MAALKRLQLHKLPKDFGGIGKVAKCLEGNAVYVYERMSDEERCDYEKLKEALKKVQIDRRKRL